MRFGIIADLHLRGSDHKIFNKAFNSALSHMQSKDVDWILCCGDIFDKPQIRDKYADGSTIIKSILDPIVDHQIPMITVLGNHDYSASSLTENGIYLLAENPLIRMYSHPQNIYLTDNKIKESVAIGTMPWVWKAFIPPTFKENFKDYWNNYFLELKTTWQKQPNVYKILLGHCDIEGAYNSYGYTIPGNSHTFEKTQLEIPGADLIALGHIHLRQDYYVGAFRQLNYGEEGNPTGWLYVDTNTGEQEFFENELSPKYYTIKYAGSSDDYDSISRLGLSSFRSCDKIRWNGAIPDKSLLPIELQLSQILVPPNRNTQRRENQDLTVNNSVRDLLDAWGKANDVDITPELLACFNESVVDKTLINFITNSHGCLDSLDRLYVDGITTHVDRDHSFTHGWWGIEGAVGRGKSTYLDSFLVACFGDVADPGRSTLPGLLRPDCDTGTIIAEFTVNAKQYRVVRTICRPGSGVSGSQLDERIDNDHWNTIATKITPVENEIRLLVGDKDLFLGSAYLSQYATQDLLACKDTDSMEFIRRFFNLDKFDRIAKLIKDKIDQEEKNLEDSTNKLLNLQKIEEKIHHEKQLFVNRKKEIEEYNKKVSELNEKGKSLLEELNRVVKDNSDNHELKTKLFETNSILQKDLYRLQQKERELVNSYKAESLRIAGDIKNREYKLDVLKDQSELLNNAGCASVGYMACPLIDSAFSAKQCIPEIEKEIVQYKNILIKFNDEQESCDELINLRKQILVKEEVIKDNQRELNSATISSKQSYIDSINYNINEINVKFDAANKHLSSLTYSCGQLSNEIKKSLEQLKEKVDLENCLQDVNNRICNFKLLYKAFGKEGIPQLLISNAIPRLQEIIDDICEQDFNNEFGLELATLRESNKRLKETFTINFIRGNYIYPVSCCSGGQKAAIRSIFRTALILYQIEHYSNGWRVLFMDEPTVHQDEEYIELVVKMLGRLQTKFNQIFICTHNQDLLREIPNKIVI